VELELQIKDTVVELLVLWAEAMEVVLPVVAVEALELLVMMLDPLIRLERVEME
jgi:hypothetical protein